MKVSTILLFVLLTSNVFGQRDNVVLKFCPLALVDFNVPAIQAGIEFKLSNKITWYNELGIKYIKGAIEQYADTNFVPSKGFKVKSEIRYYFKNKGKFKFNGNYFATNLFFTQDWHNRAITYSQTGSSSAKVNDFGVKKNVSGLNIVYGFQKSLSENFSIDLYVGMGFRVRNISTVNEQYNKTSDIILDPIDPRIWEIGEKVDANGGVSIQPNLTMGFRLCYNL